MVLTLRACFICYMLYTLVRTYLHNENLDVIALIDNALAIQYIYTFRQECFSIYIQYY